MSESKPDVDALIAIGLAIISKDINKLETTADSAALSKNEIDSLNTHMRLLLAMKREAKDADIKQRLNELEGKELNKLAQEAYGFLQEDLKNRGEI